MAKNTPIPKEKQAQILLWILLLYVLFQLSWWGYLLIADYRETLALNPSLTIEQKEALLHKKIAMLIGEGSVFIVLMIIGFYYLQRSISKELQLARMQKTFLLSVTHELKTPIAAVKLFLDTLKTRKLSPEQTTALLNDALKETKRLQSLSENILLAQRIEEMTKEIFKENVNFSSILLNEIARYREVFGREIKQSIADEIILRGDRHLLQSLCDNLLENAIKYSPKDSVVEITCHEKKGSIELTIKDNGIGIPNSEKEHIFKKFYRVGNEETRSHKGTGLGLFIVANVIKLHGGNIFIADNLPCGTVVTTVLNNSISENEK